MVRTRSMDLRCHFMKNMSKWPFNFTGYLRNFFLRFSFLFVFVDDFLNVILTSKMIPVFSSVVDCVFYLEIFLFFFIVRHSSPTSKWKCLTGLMIHRQIVHYMWIKRFVFYHIIHSAIHLKNGCNSFTYVYFSTYIIVICWFWLYC